MDNLVIEFLLSFPRGKLPKGIFKLHLSHQVMKILFAHANQACGGKGLYV